MELLVIRGYPIEIDNVNMSKKNGTIFLNGLKKPNIHNKTLIKEKDLNLYINNCKITIINNIIPLLFKWRIFITKI